MTTKEVTKEEMISIASNTLYGNGRHISNDELISEFGASVEILLLEWRLLTPHLPGTSKPHHLLWWLYLCKHYPTKKTFAKAMRVSPPTSRRAMQPIKLAFLMIRNKVIRWKDRLKHDKGRTCKTYHDGVDFKVFNKRNPLREDRPEWRRYPFDPSYNSHKFNYAGLRYGITTCIQTAEIVACHGPFPAGQRNDLTIYRQFVKPNLLPGEMVEADSAYQSDPTVRGPSDFFCRSEKVAKQRLQSRHETINGRLESFRCLRYQFRHSHHEHKYFFYTAAVTVQLMLRKYGTFYVSY